MCPLCESSRKPQSARPAHLAKTLEFNAIVAIDLFYLNLYGEERIFLIVVDHGTGLMQAARCANAKSATVQDVFASLWVRPFGFPELVISDLGPEFYGEPFQEFLSSAGTAMRFTDAMSPWKNGKAERAVQTVKSKLKTVLAETSATDCRGAGPLPLPGHCSFQPHVRSARILSEPEGVRKINSDARLVASRGPPRPGSGHGSRWR